MKPYIIYIIVCITGFIGGVVHINAVNTVFAKPEVTGKTSTECLSEALYHEARGESEKGQLAVAGVIYNRVVSSHFPNTVCEVVEQENSRGCQFSYRCDGLPNDPKREQDKATASLLADAFLNGGRKEMLQDAGISTRHQPLFYHTTQIKPYWSKELRELYTVENHIFYTY